MQLVDPRPARAIPIRITPLIDVVFILLVFFMLTSRLLPVDHLELAHNTAQSGTTTGEPLPTLTINIQGQVQWQAQALPLDRLLVALEQAGVTEVNLTTEPATSLGHFTATLSALTANGIKPHWKRATKPTP